MQITRSILSLIMCLGAATVATMEAAGAEAARLSPQELAILNSISGYGEPVAFSASHDCIAAGNTLGFSVKCAFPGNGRHYSYIALPRNDGFDTVEFDLYVESADQKAHISLCLVESNNNHWVVWDGAPASLPLKTWKHFSVPRAGIHPWKLAEQEPDWNGIQNCELLTSDGAMVFCLDNLRIGKDGKSLNLFNALDDGMKTPADWSAPMQQPIPVGLPIFTLRASVLEGGPDHASPYGLRRDCGGDVGVAFEWNARDPALSKELNAQGFPTAFYTQFANGYMKYFTTRQAWDVTASGKSLNWNTPGDPELGNSYHTIAVAHPAVREAQKERADTLVKSGINTWIVPDYVIPYFTFGYSEAMTRAFRDDLAGNDAGLHVVSGGAENVIHFQEYFADYNGFFPKPADVGVPAWNQYARPRESDPELFRNRGTILFWHLAAYEWLKAADLAGRDLQARGGQGLWLMPNPENIWSPDYIYALRSAGVRGISQEWFGQAALGLEYASSSWPYAWEEAHVGHARITIDTETGYDGHGAPYWDWRYAYQALYGITAATHADNVIIDFIDESAYSFMSDPANVDQFKRYRDGVAKARAFRQAYSEGARSPFFDKAPALCVADRPAGRHTISPLIGADNATLAFALSRARVPFHIRDCRGLGQLLKTHDYALVAYCPMIPRVGDFELLQKWLASGKNRVLLTHSYIPTRDARDFLHADRGVTLGKSDGGQILGLGAIRGTTEKTCTITSAEGTWKEFFPVGKELPLASPLTVCEKGSVKVMTDKGPLVSEVAVGDSRVVYLHFTPNAGTLSAPDPRTAWLGIAAVSVIRKELAITAACTADESTLVQIFNVKGGQSILAWDEPSLQAVRKPDDWKLQRPAFFDAPGVARTVRMPATGNDAAWLVYNFWTDQQENVKPVDGSITLTLKDAAFGLWYAGEDSPQFRTTLEQAKSARNALLKLGFWKVP